MNQIRLHGRIVKSKEGLNEGVLNSYDDVWQLRYHQRDSFSHPGIDLLVIHGISGIKEPASEDDPGLLRGKGDDDGIAGIQSHCLSHVGSE